MEIALDATAQLAREDWATHEPDTLLDSMSRLERMQAHLDAAKIALAKEIVRTQVAEKAGWASAKDFLTAAARGQKGSGPSLVRLSERLADLPSVQAGLVAGTLSRAQASVIAGRIATLPRHSGLRAAAESLLVKAAAHLDASDLTLMWPKVIEQIDPDGKLLTSEEALDKLERAAHRARRLSFTPNKYGGVKITGYGTLEDAELIKESLQSMAAPVKTEPGACGGNPRGGLGNHRGSCPDGECAHDGRDPRDHGARMWDALVEACKRLQTADVLPTSHGAGPRLMVTTSLDQLLAGLDERGLLPAGTLPGGQPLSAAAVRRLACDAEVIPATLGAQGQILDVGRASRLVTLTIWYALILRDHHCAFPGCTRVPRACDAHHIVHWVDGGKTSLDNLVLLCRRHHTFIHHTPWQVRIDNDTGRPVWIPPPDTGVRLNIRGPDPWRQVA